MAGKTTLKAGTGVAFGMRQGQRLTIVNTYGSQVVDCWAFKSGDSNEFMSMPHCRNAWFRLTPRVGDALVTNLRNPGVLSTLGYQIKGQATIFKHFRLAGAPASWLMRPKANIAIILAPKGPAVLLNNLVKMSVQEICVSLVSIGKLTDVQGG